MHSFRLRLALSLISAASLLSLGCEGALTGEVPRADAASPEDAAQDLGSTDASVPPTDANVEPFDGDVVPFDGDVADAATTDAATDAGPFVDAATDAITPDASVPVDVCDPAVLRARALGLHHSAEEAALWRRRSDEGPYLSVADNTTRGLPAGAPASWSSIEAMARAFVVSGSVNADALTRDTWPGYNGGSSWCMDGNDPWVCGIHAMMTGFYAFVRDDVTYARAAKAGVMAQVRMPHATFEHPDSLSDCCGDSTCMAADPGLPRAVGCNSYQQGVFTYVLPMIRALHTYDYTRHFAGLYSDAERNEIHVAYRRVMDWYFRANESMTNCVSDTNYDAEGNLLVASLGSVCDDVTMCSGRRDVSAYEPSECIAFGTWDHGASDFACYTTIGPSNTRQGVLDWVSQNYNNRLSLRWELVATAALVLKDDLDAGFVPAGIDPAWVAPERAILGAKRYVKEWVTFSTYPDGTQGEFARNGDYCTPQQGLAYGMSNYDLAMSLADALARRGDVELLAFETCEGNVNSRCQAGDSPKSLRSLAQNFFRMLDHTGDYYWGRRDDDTYRLDLLSDYGAFPSSGTPRAPSIWQWDAVFAAPNRVWNDDGIRAGYLRTRAGMTPYDFTTVAPYAGRGFRLRENSLSGIGAISWPNPHGAAISGFTQWMGPHATSPSLLFMFGGTEDEPLPVYDCAKERLADE